jgi:hypothetical protein
VTTGGRAAAAIAGPPGPGARPPPSALARALDYPYPRPGGSFVYDAGDHAGDQAVQPLEGAAVGAWAAGRRPILAVGSNAAPDQLRRKFATFPGDRHVVAVAVEVRGHDVVYAARVTAYGAVPATLVRCPAATVAVWALLLTPGQLLHLDGTESLGQGYDLAAVEARAVGLPGGSPLDDVVVTGGAVGCYVAVRGPMLVGAAPVALAAVRASGRAWRAMTEGEVLARLGAATGLGVAGFVGRALGDARFRADVGARLAAGAL